MSILFTYLFFFILFWQGWEQWKELSTVQTQNILSLVLVIIFYNLRHKVVTLHFLTATATFLLDLIIHCAFDWLLDSKNSESSSKISQMLQRIEKF